MSKKIRLTPAMKTEAMRLARNEVKDEIKRQGMKVSHFEASEITRAATELLKQSPSIARQARKNVLERKKRIEKYFS